MIQLMTNSDLAFISERVDRYMDGDLDALTPNDVSTLLAEVIELRGRRTAAALMLDGRAHPGEGSTGAD